MRVIHEVRLFQKTALFFRQLRELLVIGVPIDQALETLIQQEPEHWYRQRLALMQSRFMATGNLVQNLDLILPKLFALNCGTLPFIPCLLTFLEALSLHLSERGHLFKTLFRQMLYPLFLIGSCLGMGLFFGVVLLPTFMPLLSGQPLPTLVLVLSQTKSLLYHWGYGIAGVGLGLGAWVTPTLYHVGVQRVWGPAAYGQVFWLLGAFMNSGLSLKEGLEHLQLPDQHSCRGLVSELSDMVFQYGFQSDRIATLFQLGAYESTLLRQGGQNGQLAQAFQQISERLESQAFQRCKRVIQWVQPVCFLVIGLLILFMLQLLFLPLQMGLD